MFSGMELYIATDYGKIITFHCIHVSHSVLKQTYSSNSLN